MFRDVAKITRYESQPLHPTVDQTVVDVRAVTSKLVDSSKVRRIKGRELAKLDGVLIQFTDYVPTLQPYAQTSYSYVKDIYDSVTGFAAHTDQPLTFAEQLHIALVQTKGDLPEALWRLFLASRLYGRWLDDKSISNLPEFSRKEKIDMMTQWERSLAGCKKEENATPQDVGGDTYYVWTHALGKVANEALPEKSNLKTRLAARTFERGTKLMHKTTHKMGKNQKHSDHTIAAEYGNAIGAICSEILNPSRA